jgi:hypothetical protein
MTWLIANWRFTLPIFIALVGGGTFGAWRCHAQQAREDAAEADRAKTEAAKALGRAEAREDVAAQFGGMVAPLDLQAATAAQRAESAARAAEAEQARLRDELDAGREASADELRMRLETLWSPR